MSGSKGRVALITGATHGLGPAIARALARQGTALVLQHHDDAAGATALAEDLAAAGGEALALTSELGDILAVQRLVDEAYQWRGRLDVLVNAAEHRVGGPLLQVTPEDWQLAFRDGVTAAFFTTQAAAKYMLLDRRGRIVNVTGLEGAYPGRAQACAAAAKGALNALTRALAVELAPKQIAVNAVAPGGAVGPEAVAEVVAFLASDDASYVTGEVFYVDEGASGRR